MSLSEVQVAALRELSIKLSDFKDASFAVITSGGRDEAKRHAATKIGDDLNSEFNRRKIDLPSVVDKQEFLDAFNCLYQCFLFSGGDQFGPGSEGTEKAFDRFNPCRVKVDALAAKWGKLIEESNQAREKSVWSTASLREVMKAVPSLKYAFAVFAVVIGVVLILMVLQPQVAVLGAVLFVFLMILLVVFATIVKQSEGQASPLRTPAVVVIWFTVLGAVAVGSFAISSFFFGKPLDWRVERGVEADHRTQTPSPSATPTPSATSPPSPSAFSVLDRQSDRNVGPVAFSPDGELVAWAVEKEIKVASTYSESVRWSKEDESSVRTLAFSHDGELLVAGGEPGVRVRSAADGQSRADLDLSDPNADVMSIAVSCSGTLAVGTLQGDVYLRQLRDPDVAAVRSWHATILEPMPGVTPPPLRPGMGKICNLTSVAFSRAGDRLATAGRDNEVRIWSVPNGKQVQEFAEFDSWTNCVAFSPSGEEIAVACQEGVTKFILLVPNRRGCISTSLATVRQVAYSPSGNWIAASVAGPDFNSINLLDPAPQTLSSHVPPTAHLRHKTPITSFAVSPKGDRIVSAAQDGVVRLWRICWRASAEVFVSAENQEIVKRLDAKRSGKGIHVRVRFAGSEAICPFTADDIMNNRGRIVPLPCRLPVRDHEIAVAAQLLLGTDVRADANSRTHTTETEGVLHTDADNITLTAQYRDGEASVMAKVTFLPYQCEDNGKPIDDYFVNPFGK